MKAQFADLSERTRQWDEQRRAYRRNERRRVWALCDAIQIASASGQQKRVGALLDEMHALVDRARRGRPQISEDGNRS
jgi:hypothetical protein